MREDCTIIKMVIINFGSATTYRHCRVAVRHLSSLKTHLKLKVKVKSTWAYKTLMDYQPYSSIQSDVLLRHDSTNLEGKVKGTLCSVSGHYLALDGTCTMVSYLRSK